MKGSIQYLNKAPLKQLKSFQCGKSEAVKSNTSTYTYAQAIIFFCPLTFYQPSLPPRPKEVVNPNSVPTTPINSPPNPFEVKSPKPLASSSLRKLDECFDTLGLHIDQEKLVRRFGIYNPKQHRVINFLYSKIFFQILHRAGNNHSRPRKPTTSFRTCR